MITNFKHPSPSKKLATIRCSIVGSCRCVPRNPQLGSTGRWKAD